MTREEAIKWLEETIQDTDTYWNSCSEALQKELDEQKEVFLMALSALRPVSREQVEKVWRGECDCTKTKACCTCCAMRCQYCIGQSEYKQASFCMKCGRPLTTEAVQMVMERMEALHETV